MHPEITKKDFKSFAERYKNSDEEAQDLIEFYEEQEGDMTKILEFIMCSENEDLPRFLAFFDAKISCGELPKFKAYQRTRAKVDMMPDEKAEAKAEK
jgi:DnaJ family protein C protein 9